jgi:hypothetical protein
LRTRLGIASNIIVACCVLHNLALLWSEGDFNEENPPLHEDEQENENDVPFGMSGRDLRDWLRDTYC